VTDPHLLSDRNATIQPIVVLCTNNFHCLAFPFPIELHQQTIVFGQLPFSVDGATGQRGVGGDASQPIASDPSCLKSNQRVILERIVAESGLRIDRCSIRVRWEATTRVARRKA